MSVDAFRPTFEECQMMGVPFHCLPHEKFRSDLSAYMPPKTVQPALQIQQSVHPLSLSTTSTATTDSDVSTSSKGDSSGRSSPLSIASVKDAELELARERGEDIIRDMTRIDEVCSEEVPSARSVGNMEELFQDVEDFSLDFGGAKGYKLTGILTEPCTLKGSDGKVAKYIRATAVFEGNPEAQFEIAFNPETGDCCIEKMYRGDLPTWVQFGDKKHWLDPNKGVPTAKVIAGLLMAKLGMNKNNVATFKAGCINPQTFVDAIHASVIEAQPFSKAFASSHTATLALEQAQILGIKRLRLMSVKAAVSGGRSNIPHYLNTTGWSEQEKAKFRA